MADETLKKSRRANVASVDLSSYLKVGEKEELEALLTYWWDINKIKEVLARSTVIEVFLNVEDKIVDAQKTLDFFCF